MRMSELLPTIMLKRPATRKVLCGVTFFPPTKKTNVPIRASNVPLSTTYAPPKQYLEQSETPRNIPLHVKTRCIDNSAGWM